MPTKGLHHFNIAEFQTDLITWFDNHKRDLPWRENQDPYRVWVSEVMLQQTQVDTVIPYFYRFMEQFPTVYELASAEEEEVLKAWEGLGYYSRARNLQHAVKEVVSDYAGKVPDNPEQLGDLKGVGPYTRGAILSIAYGQAEPAVDGNVMRVLSRVLWLEDDIAVSRTRKKFEEVARELIPGSAPSSFNQAVMELGALVCTPKAPMCLLCPINTHCKAYAEGIQEQLPVKTKKTKQKKKPYFVAIIKNYQGKVILEKRPKEGLLANLWQFPMIPGDLGDLEQAKKWLHNEYSLNVTFNPTRREQLKHVFSHIIWELEIYDARIDLVENDVIDERLLLVDVEQIKDYPLSTSHQKIMAYL